MLNPHNVLMNFLISSSFLFFTRILLSCLLLLFFTRIFRGWLLFLIFGSKEDCGILLPVVEDSVDDHGGSSEAQDDCDQLPDADVVPARLAVRVHVRQTVHTNLQPRPRCQQRPYHPPRLGCWRTCPRACRQPALLPQLLRRTLRRWLH